VTIVEEPKARSAAQDPELLFREAKRRRSRRWLGSGIVLVVLALLGLTLSHTFGGAGRMPSGSVRTPPPITGAGHSGMELSFRPVLCYAPPLSLAAGHIGATGPLPACSPPSQLTAANLNVTPDSNGVTGYTYRSDVPSDPQFAAYLSTTAGNNPHATILIPGIRGAGNVRYVLGPVALTQTGVASAHATHNGGVWTVDLALTPRGSLAWDSFTHQQFHQIIGTDLNGRVISAPIVQPTQSSWSSVEGHVQISGSFTEQQAKAIATGL
jgi:hypothetical protein